MARSAEDVPVDQMTRRGPGERTHRLFEGHDQHAATANDRRRGDVWRHDHIEAVEKLGGI